MHPGANPLDALLRGAAQGGGQPPNAGPPSLVAPGRGVPDAPDNPAAARALAQMVAAGNAFLAAEQDPHDKAVVAAMLSDLHKLAGSRAAETFARHAQP